MSRELTDDLEKVLAALASMFAHEGKAKEVAVLAHCKASIEQTNFDNWNGGTYGYTIHLEAPKHLYAQIADQQESIEELLRERIKGIVRLYENQWVEAFVITTELVEDPHWREKAKAWVDGKGVTNQGRARSDNVAPLMCDGLLFRSQPEIHLYRALRGSGLSFAPLPVFVRGGQTYRRIEPDFVLIKDGITMVVEVDGDTVHRESPQEAHDRVTMLLHEGVHVERVKAGDCDTPEEARQCAAKIQAILAKLKENR